MRRWLTGTNVPIYLAIVGLFIGQQLLATVLSPVARASGLTEIQVGTIWAASSLMFVLMSPIWGWVIARIGERRVLITSLVGSALALTAFAVLASAATSKLIEPSVAYPLMIAVRSILFGVFGSATPVAAQSYIASSTNSEQSRVRGLAGVGASFAIAGIIGPALGGILASWSVLAPLYGSGAVVIMAVTVVWFNMREPQTPETMPNSAEDLEPASDSIRALSRRVLPYLGIGLALWLTSSLHSVVLSFVLQDRLGLDASHTGNLTGIAFVAAGIASAVVQLGLLRMVKLKPRVMITTGIAITASGLVVLTVAQVAVLLVVGTTFVAIGLALAVPGYTASTTLQVHQGAQGTIAGLMAANNSLGSVIAPIAATTLYTLNGSYPYYFALSVLAIALAVTVLVVRNHSQSGEMTASSDQFASLSGESSTSDPHNHPVVDERLQ